MKYVYDGKTFLIHEGELYVKAEPVEVAGGGEKLEVALRKKHRKRRLKSPSPKQTKTDRGARVVSKRGKRGSIDPALKAAIAREYKEGATVSELSKKYKQLSYGSVYLAAKGGIPKAKGNSGEPLKLLGHLQAYVCPDGHHFESKLPLSHARCPDCNQLAETVDEPKPVVEEAIS